MQKVARRAGSGITIDGAGHRVAFSEGPLVELRGFEPLTSAVRLQRSPN